MQCSDALHLTSTSSYCAHCAHPHAGHTFAAWWHWFLCTTTCLLSSFVTHTNYGHLARLLQLHCQHMQCSDASHLNLKSLCSYLATLLQLGGIGFVHYNMPLEQQVEAVKSVKQQPAGFEANPIILSPKQELKQIQDIQACVHGFPHRLPCICSTAALLCLYSALPCSFALHVCIACFQIQPHETSVHVLFTRHLV